MTQFRDAAYTAASAADVEGGGGGGGLVGVQVSIDDKARSGDFRPLSMSVENDVTPERFKGASAAATEPSKISPLLRERIGDDPQQLGNVAETLVINLVVPLLLPLFPALPMGTRRDALDSGQRPVDFAEVERLVAELTGAREESVNAFLASFGSQEITLLETFWLINAALVEAPLRLVPEIAQHPSVLFIQLNEGEIVPGQRAGPNGPNGRRGDEPILVRAAFNSDPYAALGLNGGYIGVVGTGMRAGHRLLRDYPDRWTGDCAHGGADCWGSGRAPNGTVVGTPNYNPGDCANHGTPAIGIISGNANRGPELRGITPITTDSWKAVDSGCQFRTAAVIRAVQKAVASFDSVVSNSWTAFLQNPASATATLMDNAFDVGAVVIASSGNDACHTDGQGGPDPLGTGPAGDGDCHHPIPGAEPAFGSVGSPAEAHKVIAVGAWNVLGNCPDNGRSYAPPSGLCAYSSRGPTPDLRLKPDILGYTNIEAASSWGTAATWAWPGFNGTSAAAPTIAALAMLYHNWMQAAVPSPLFNGCPTRQGPSSPSGALTSAAPGARRVCAGHVYAYLLNSAPNNTAWEGAGWNGRTGAQAALNLQGAGRPVAPLNGWAGWGTVDPLVDSQRVNVAVAVPTDACNFDATIWWPEAAGLAHSDVDFSIVDPSGVAQSTADSGPSVWERATVRGPLQPGVWTVSLFGFAIPAGTQPVYFAWTFHTGAGCP